MQKVDIMSEEGSKLLARLRKGQVWLTEEWLRIKSLTSLPSGEVSDRYLDALNLWCNLESQLRTIHGFRGCVMGEKGCDDLAPVRCDKCAELIVDTE